MRTYIFIKARILKYFAIFAKFTKNDNFTCIIGYFLLAFDTDDMDKCFDCGADLQHGWSQGQIYCAPCLFASPQRGVKRPYVGVTREDTDRPGYGPKRCR